MVPCSGDTSSLTLELVLLHRKGHVQQVNLLLLVCALQTSSHGSGWVTSSIQDVTAVVVLRVVEQSLDTGLNKRPGTSVERLLLTPDNALGIRVAVEVLLQLLPWERSELLDSCDGDIGELLLLTMRVKSSVGLTSAHDNALNLVVRLDLEIVSAVV